MSQSILVTLHEASGYPATGHPDDSPLDTRRCSGGVVPRQESPGCLYRWHRGAPTRVIQVIPVALAALVCIFPENSVVTPPHSPSTSSTGSPTSSASSSTGQGPPTQHPAQRPRRRWCAAARCAQRTGTMPLRRRPCWPGVGHRRSSSPLRHRRPSPSRGQAAEERPDARSDRLSGPLPAHRPDRHQPGPSGAEIAAEGPFSTPAPAASRALKRGRRVTRWLTCGNGKARITLRRSETARRRPPCANPVLAGRPLRHRPRFQGRVGGVLENRNWHKGE